MNPQTHKISATVVRRRYSKQSDDVSSSSEVGIMKPRSKSTSKAHKLAMQSQKLASLPAEVPAPPPTS